MSSIITSVNAVFERDIAVTMQLVANNKGIIFLDPATDFYTNTSKRNQEACDNIIGNSNYDIGHLLFVLDGEDYAGYTSPGSVCGGSKANAVSGGTSLRNYNTLLHEIGHQLGASHTYNSAGEYGVSGVEIGYGRTIMSYGISSERLFYHSVSIQQMRNFVQSRFGNCASITNTGNTPPTANAGDDYIIPKSTPYFIRRNSK